MRAWQPRVCSTYNAHRELRYIVLKGCGSAWSTFTIEPWCSMARSSRPASAAWLDVALAATTSPASCLSAAGSADGNTPAWTWVDIMDLGTDTVSLHYAIRIQRGTNLDGPAGASLPSTVPAGIAAPPQAYLGGADAHLAESTRSVQDKFARCLPIGALMAGH